MTIRAATSVDHRFIIAIWEKSVRATHDFLNEKDIEELRPLIENEYLYALDLFVIENEHPDILGFIGVSGDFVEMLFVDPEHFRKGLGKKLMLFAINKIKITRIDVNEQNLNAKLFYESLGFSVISRSSVDRQGKAYPILHMKLDLEVENVF